MPALRGPLQEMRRQASRMTAIVQDLLELSRLEAEGRVAEGEPIDVGALMARAAQRPAGAHAAWRWTCGCSWSPPSGCAASRRSCIPHSPTCSTTPPSTRRRAARSRCAGGATSAAATLPSPTPASALPPEHLPRLTERFYRVDAGRSRASGGSGLGLAIVKHVLQRHGASLQIESEEGSGSTFTCHFPPARLRVAHRASETHAFAAAGL